MQLSKLPRSELLALWVDAICITQADDAGKSHQLELMATIYRKARETIVWLGPEAAHSRIAMRSLKLLSRFASETDFFRIDLHRFPKDEDESSTVRCMIDGLDFGLETSNQVPLLSLEAFFDRSWWERVWTLQEVALAQSVHYVCGSEQLRWDELDAAIFILFLKYETLTSLDYGELLRSILHKMKNRQEYRRKMHNVGDTKPTLPLAEAMDMAFEKSLQCSDHGDHVYGMLGMASDATSKLVDINYAINTVRSVYTQIAKLFLEQHGLRVFHYCYLRPDTDFGIFSPQSTLDQPSQQLHKVFRNKTSPTPSAQFVHSVTFRKMPLFTRKPHDSSKIPSWVLQWQSPRIELMFGADRLTKDVRLSKRHHASSGLRSLDQPMHFGNNGTLTLYGSTVDKISTLASWPQDSPNLNTWLQELSALIETSAMYGSLEQKKDAVFRTSCADFMRGPYMRQRPAQASDRTCFDILFDHRPEYGPIEEMIEQPIEGSYIGDDFPIRFCFPQQQQDEDKKLCKDTITTQSL